MTDSFQSGDFLLNELHMLMSEVVSKALKNTANHVQQLPKVTAVSAQLIHSPAEVVEWNLEPAHVIIQKLHLESQQKLEVWVPLC